VKILTKISTNRIIGLWAAYLLPPMVQTQEWDWRKHASSITAKAARYVEPIDSNPYLYGEFFLQAKNNQLYRVREDASGTRTEVVSRNGLFANTPLFKEHTGALPDSAWNFKLKHRESNFELADSKLSFFPNGFSKPLMWFSPLPGFHWVSFSRSPTNAFLAMEPVEGVLLHFSKARDRVNLYRWDPTSQLIRFFSCDANQDLMVENSPDLGLSRFVFWSGGRPTAYTVFDFSGSERKSEVTWVEAFDCRDIVVGGSFGLRRVRY